MSRVVKITMEVDEAELKEFLDDHYGYDEEDDKEYSDEEIEIAIKDEIGCLI
ncbi:hypothetical protein [Anaerotignum sp. MB30-C6]|uniref:hypothetical protein n=1 Tax=Anaerotignum sp. MB30-C6 TaxID=3070814 RepID=UPI0027DDC8CC|nr:hypothetical protein [Anaerotignum sp. MB30-C6]WMI81926.1 hypothetical protein RBQ60_04130 [Anaerotignum sp. MB30-C6]